MRDLLIDAEFNQSHTYDIPTDNIVLLIDLYIDLKIDLHLILNFPPHHLPSSPNECEQHVILSEPIQ